MAGLGANMSKKER